MHKWERERERGTSCEGRLAAAKLGDGEMVQSPSGKQWTCSSDHLIVDAAVGNRVIVPENSHRIALKQQMDTSI